jgi:MFS transporter, PPP family, 3-phenylpropionic acid transporter
MIIIMFNHNFAMKGIYSYLGILVAAPYKSYIFNLAPAKYKAGCLSLAEAIIGLAAIISAPIFGSVFAKYGTNSTILFGLIINIVASIVMLKGILSK